MSVAIVTGSAGLVGCAASRLFAARGLDVIGIDNDMRRHFFGPEASTVWSRSQLEAELDRYTHHDIDIRDRGGIDALFERYGSEISVVVHAAAQPSHDWAARDPHTDFSINAEGTLNLLQSTRSHCPDAAFVFCSTNKVYGDSPNRLPLEELEWRWELRQEHPYWEHGIDESMSVDACLHSLFGVSKLSGDLLVQEYGRNFGMKTVAFRGGCLTGAGHSGAELHGFLAYLVKCAVTRAPYTVFGYKGKQVRDNIHAADLAEAFWQFFLDPRCGEVYNIGGGRRSNCSVLEAIRDLEKLAGRQMRWTYDDTNRVGDHLWWISDCRKFQRDYPEWSPRYGHTEILREIYDTYLERFGES